MGLMQRLAAPFRGAPATPARVEPTLPPLPAPPAPPPAAGPAAPGAAAQESSVHRPEQWLTASFGRPSAAGRRVGEADVMSLPAVMQALRILCGVFAMTPMHYHRATAQGSERATEDPLYDLFHANPNGVQTAFGFKELLLGDILLAGRFAAWTSRDRLQTPTALTRLDPNQVHPVEFFSRDEGVSIFFDATLPDGSRERFAPRDVWHVPGMGRGLTGLNPVAFMRDALGAALATGDYAAKFWANDAKPSVVLAAPKDVKIPRSDKQALREDWDALHAGAGRSHSTAVLDQGLEAKFLSHDNQHSQFIETRTFQVLEVARIFGVPPHLLFELSRATFGNIEQQSLEFVIYHLGPHYQRVSEAATKAFAAPGCWYEFLPDALVKGDLKSRMEAYAIQRNIGMANADELRRRDNINPIGGRAGEEYWRPANMAISGTDPATPATPPVPQEP